MSWFLFFASGANLTAAVAYHSATFAVAGAFLFLASLVKAAAG